MLAFFQDSNNKSKILVLNAIILFSLISSCSTVKVISAEYTKVVTSNQKNLKTNSCNISIIYPKIINLKNRVLQNEINSQIENNFISGLEDLCLDDPLEEINSNVERNFNYYITSDSILSIISIETFSSNFISGQKINTYNIDLNTGVFLIEAQIINSKYYKEFEQLILEEFRSQHPKKKHYYTEKEQDESEVIVDFFKIAFTKKSMIIYIRGASEVEGITSIEIPRKSLIKYLKYNG